MNKILKLILLAFGVLILIGIFTPPSEQPIDKQNASTSQLQATENTSSNQYAIPEQTSSQQATEQTSSASQNGNLTVHFIDVGQGDSILVEYAGKTMLIDAGEKNMGSTVSSYLKQQGVSSLDNVVATHPHADHIGGLITILNGYPVSNFIDSGVPHTSQTYEDMLTTIDSKNIPFHVAQRGENIDFAPGVTIQVLNPGKEQSEDLNEDSVVLKITDNDVSFLLMGDAGLEAESSIMSEGYDVNADILKVGHHASTSGSGPKFISAVSPDISVIEVGAGNDYGHPHAETLERLQSASTVYRTDYHGTITITTDGSIYTVTTEKTAPTQTSTISTAPTEDTTTTSTSKSEDSSYYSTPTSTSDDTAAEPSQTSTSDEGVYVTGLDLKNEWVKIKNSGSSTMDLTGWAIRDEGDKHTYTFPSFQLEAGATVTLHTEDGTNTGTELYWGSGNSIWNNDGDTAFLYDSSGNLVSSLEG
ncbi:lamin tail domain-containing protein [uncultured Methanomethylovorans sp.]|uniref:lamin tail domain-containing protein n=1 Tax=uncultured Methanomethylovorans sp. TaxID=183759 RepID=UPI002AA72D1D|nr:lamin tail domain-containing protein [uncultured Methanomethylovorans sp.]